MTVAASLLRCCRMLELAAWHVPWRQDLHEPFPPAFRAATRTMLLARHRGEAELRQAGDGGGGSARRRSGRGGRAAPVSAGGRLLALLEPELLLKIAGSAAYPLSAWL